ncbi:glucans biosynthesis glucosyltransferase MdoH [Meridianimarinicoccus roseus]|uniref:Glucans biosynthesis glucosyltransferase H n=1 Tax=Meridianimarinicoccus roseus TaxID=2072018 RepID=A0A2V2LH41_9RHOB|nr:glucans biosynthesis glucosyltransferase MdoH [Meridianimarinicoccus roseus]PWR03301.1 glucans biosynthesis glucosyltransferase MdoH [Meridianimarinicoccus roseus]
MTVRAQPRAGAVPPRAPLAMPTRPLAPFAPRHRLAQGGRVHAARAVAFGGAAGLSVLGFTQMSQVFGNESSTLLQTLLLALFTVTFGWIALSATQALAAAFAAPPPPDDGGAASGCGAGRTAILMPVYNEDPAATCAALQAMGEGIAQRGLGDAFEIFVLSDTTDPAVWVRETACHAALRRALHGKMQVWYRRRKRNIGRKAGNLRDFVEGWGARYDHMLVLDADSLMDPDTVIALAHRMAVAPRLGILQTVPVLAGGRTVFARLQEFAGRVYGPVIARGVSAWQGRDGNYWGHNAIIRTAAFAQCCGLPELPGRSPFGGHVLSHDFVEAALIRRGGWEVRMDPDLGGSWEGAPQTLLDLAARDRRWAQGNLQHAAVLGAPGLAWANRAHFLIGIGSYLMSSVWLALLVTGGLLTGQSLIYEREYFSDGPQLFPHWPVFDAERMMWLLALSMALLFLPKITGIVRALVLPALRRSFGGGWRILGGAALEVVLSALIAPVLMLFQVRQVVEILAGRDGGWSAQSRDAADMPWRRAIAAHVGQVALGTAALVAVVILAPAQIVWLAPVLVGLVLAPVLSRQTGRVADGTLGRLLWIPEDRNVPEVARRCAALKAAYVNAAGVSPADLLSDQTLAAIHLDARMDDQAPDMVTGGSGGTDLDLVTGAAKLAAASHPDEALSWLSPAETRAVLGDGPALRRACARFSDSTAGAPARRGA